MDFNNFNFNDFFDYIQNNQNTSNCDCNCDNQNYSSESQSNDNTNCNDIPGGFQNLNPQVFITLGELLGNIMSANLPFNVQNALGNWLQLVGQTILTFNSQQQYFQGGPGRYYNLKYKNVANPFCPTPTSQTDTSQTSDSYEPLKTNTKSLNKYESEIKDLKKSIDELRREIDELKNNE
ncbi:hypothetical protein ST12_12680 [Clostridium botulinum]|uniref:hypothetical protein n=1 Tax=Clostridium botulinum TaxID=1491 RepID=UPI000174E16D|nr:hypothetical protein [Clostridium botulinum]ACD51556.1 conserved hypothetical protein [Clostridium botulinum E3 str. Alaska E43]AJF30520.1 hypothetical protein ST13_12680 [Clostridium botulinum]AJF33583.1 hypothetical protein ST12_12680 [Clostridium botulinum]MBN1059552.1 hypothetical protein [Clostridium botulinum]MBN1062675.1 hypothetical protein [Clostridium botulinum]